MIWIWFRARRKPSVRFFQCYLGAYGTLGNLAGPNVKGERIRLAFRVLDGDGAPLNDAMIELWQADVRASGVCPPTSRARACSRA